MGEISKFLLFMVSCVLTNNFIFSRFLGICPFLGVSSKVYLGCIPAACSIGAYIPQYDLLYLDNSESGSICRDVYKKVKSDAVQKPGNISSADNY